MSTNIMTADEKILANVAFGYTNRPAKNLSHYFKIVGDGFDVLSSQFAIHYFFKTDETLANFIYNINLCLKEGGYFIGTCFDGNRIVEALTDKDTINGQKNDTTIWSIERKYDMPFKPMQTGQTIKVFMESINQHIDEYVVDFDLLVDSLKKENIRLLTPDECLGLGLKNGISTGSFEELYNDVVDYVSNTENGKLPANEDWMKKMINDMSVDEKRVSFLNRWFIFTKGGVPPPATVERSTKVRKASKVPKEPVEPEVVEEPIPKVTKVSKVRKVTKVPKEPEVVEVPKVTKVTRVLKPRVKKPAV
jgi:SAM-dependent methyltransferase